MAKKFVDFQGARMIEGWPDKIITYLSVDDAYRLDDVRAALRRGDLRAASRLARVYTLTPVTV